MRGAVANPNAVMMSEKGIEGITPDNDFINKLLCPEPKGDGPNKKGPAKAFLTQLAHKAETRWGHASPCKGLPIATFSRLYHVVLMRSEEGHHIMQCVLCAFRASPPNVGPSAGCEGGPLHLISEPGDSSDTYDA